VTPPKARYLQVVLTSPAPGREDEFNEWYDNVHVPQVLEMPGFLSGQRFCLVDSDESTGPRYLVIYEIESDDIEATLETIKTTAPSRTKSTAIDVSASIVHMYRAFGPAQEGAEDREPVDGGSTDRS
jgi:hypothetical protein